MVKKPLLPFRPGPPRVGNGLPDRPAADVRHRSVRDAGLRAELVAHARADGRWVASVAAHEMPTAASAAWPSVNGPTAAVGLDALEAELRDAACGAQPDSEPALPRPEGR